MSQFTYMGTKRQLASRISAIVDRSPPGPFLDLFSGLSAVGAALVGSRAVWCNDMQHFSNVHTQAMFMSKSEPNVSVRQFECIEQLFAINMRSLTERFYSELKEERVSLYEGSATAFLAFNEALLSRSGPPRAQGIEKSHCLFSTIYAGGYFGLKQSMEIDSLRFAFDAALSTDEIDRELHCWFVLALCKATGAVTNSTGHFAQYLTPKTSNANRVLMKRRRSVWGEWLKSVESFQPYGIASWREKNRFFRSDANELLESLSKSGPKPSVIYADPPYTSDQYSRYYHILETVILYDYPEVFSKGQYRPDRFTSEFSLKNKVEGAFTKMIGRARETGASLLISYPETGLLDDARNVISGLLCRAYGSVSEPLAMAHDHSTMGASKGPQKHRVKELLFIAHV